jgi:hypothetical protein
MPTEAKIHPEDLRLSEETARMILERAIELDARRPGDTTLAELQRVAQELNVSSGALMEAIRELQTKAVAAPSQKSALPPEPAPAPAAATGSGWWRTAAIGVGSFVFAAFNRADTGYDPAASMLLLLFGSIALVLMHRRNGTPRQYQRDLLALFGPVALVWAAGSYTAEGAVYGATFSWLLASSLGGWLTRFRRARTAEKGE